MRITTKEPLAAVPPNFAVSNPARIAFDFPNTVNALGRNSQDIGQGELRSMNIVQGTDRTRLVLNLRRSVPHEASIDGRRVLVLGLLSAGLVLVVRLLVLRQFSFQLTAAISHLIRLLFGAFAAFGFLSEFFAKRCELLLHSRMRCL